MAWSNQTLHERAAAIRHAIDTGGPLSRRGMIEFLDGVMEVCGDTLVIPPGHSHRYDTHALTPDIWLDGPRPGPDRTGYEHLDKD